MSGVVGYSLNKSGIIIIFFYRQRQNELRKHQKQGVHPTYTGNIQREPKQDCKKKEKT